MSFEAIKIALSNPIMHGKEEINEIVITREPVAGDLRGISAQDMKHDDIMEITSRLTGIPTPVIKTLKLSDYSKVSDVIGNFFTSSQ